MTPFCIAALSGIAALSCPWFELPRLDPLENEFLEADLVEVVPNKFPNHPLKRSLTVVLHVPVDEEPDDIGKVLVDLPPVNSDATAL